MKVLLLGSTGLLGRNVRRRLDDEGHEVTVLLRPLTVKRLEESSAGQDAIVNCAGVTDMSLRSIEDYMPINAILPKEILQAMKHHGIRRLVHISTVDTIGYGTADKPADEQTPMREPFASSLYAKSKLAGEEAVLQAAKENPDWHVVVINPGFMLGPDDAKPSSGRMLLAAYRRRLMFAPRGGKAFVDVRDVAQAAVAALTAGHNGSRYIVVNPHEHHAISELYEIQAAVMGYRQRVVELPNWLLKTAGAMGDMLRYAGIRTELSSNNIRQLTTYEYYDCQQAVDDLGLTHTPLVQSIADFHRWRQEYKQKQNTIVHE